MWLTKGKDNEDYWVALIEKLISSQQQFLIDLIIARKDIGSDANSKTTYAANHFLANIIKEE